MDGATFTTSEITRRREPAQRRCSAASASSTRRSTRRTRSSTRTAWPFAKTGDSRDRADQGQHHRGLPEERESVVSGPGVSVRVNGNTVTGAGPVDCIAQNGIQVSRGATATVNKNKIKDNWYADSPDATRPPAACCSTWPMECRPRATSSEAPSRTSATSGSGEEASSVSDPSIRHPLSKRGRREPPSLRRVSRASVRCSPRDNAGGQRDFSGASGRRRAPRRPASTRRVARPGSASYRACRGRPRKATA